MRVVYVNHADVADIPRRDLATRWSTSAGTLRALRARDIDVQFVGRTSERAYSTRVDGVPWSFVRDVAPGYPDVAAEVARCWPDVVHVNGIGFARATLRIRRAIGDGPAIVVQHHGEPPGRGRARFAQRAARRAVQGYCFTGAFGQAAAFRSAGIFGRATAVHEVLEAAADVVPGDRLAARSVTGLMGAPALVWVGRLMADKDPLTALHIVAGLAARHPRVHLTMICGERAMESDVEVAIAADPRLDRRVTVLGPIPKRDVEVYLRGADVMLATSRHEGSGYALIEALTCGTPAAWSDLPPHRAIAGAFPSAFAPGDVAAGIRAVERALTIERNDVLAHARTCLGWDTVASQLERAYRAAWHAP